VWILPDEEENRIERCMQNRTSCLAACKKMEEETEPLEKYMPMSHVGFYDLAANLDRLVFRASLVAAMRSKSDGIVGVMITASSRKDDMNGIKLVDKDGNPWTGHWKFVVELLVNTIDLEHSLRNMNEVTIRGYPTFSDMFGVDAIAEPLPRA